MSMIAARKITTGQAASQLGRNVLQTAKNTGHRLLQDHAALKTNSLILSSLILVLSRVFIANLSAKQAKGTPEGPLRYREAVRTTIREFCGWTFGYIILRWIQNMAKFGMRKYFGILDKDGNLPASSLGQIWQSMKRRWTENPLVRSVAASLKREEFTVAKAALDPAHPEAFRYLRTDRLEKWRPLLNKVVPGAKKLSDTALLQTLYRWAPIIVGSIPAVLLAGYALERFTRDHADKVVTKISEHFGKGSPGSTGTDPEIPVCRAQQDFDSFVNRVHQKQMQRGV